MLIQTSEGHLAAQFSVLYVCTFRRDASEYTLSFIKPFFIRVPFAQRRTVILHCFYFPKSRKSELHNVLHVGVRVNLKLCSFNTLLLCRIIDTFTLYSYNWLLNVKTVIIVLSCLYVAKKLSDFCHWNLRKSAKTFPGWNCPKIKNDLNPVPNRVNTIKSEKALEKGKSSLLHSRLHLSQTVSENLLLLSILTLRRELSLDREGYWN